MKKKYVYLVLALVLSIAADQGTKMWARSTLKPIFGGKDKVSMFEMNKHLSNHLK